MTRHDDRHLSEQQAWPSPPRIEWLRPEYPDCDAATAAIQQIADWSDVGLRTLEAGRTTWMDRRGVVVVANSTDVRLAFGVRHEVLVNGHLLRALAQVNRSDPLGHIWLTEGNREAEWSVIWGATLPYRWTSALDLQRAVISCLTDQGPYFEGLAEHFAIFGGVASLDHPAHDVRERVAKESIEWLI